MTMILSNDASARAKWRAQANKAAQKLKSIEPMNHKLGFVFDDAIVRVEIGADLIRSMTEQQLADHLYQSVITSMQTEGSA